MPLSPFTSTPINLVCPVKINPFRVPVAVSAQKPHLTSGWTKQKFHILREKTEKQSFTAVFRPIWSISAKDAFSVCGWISPSEPSLSGCCCWKFSVHICTCLSTLCRFSLWVHKKAERVASMSLLLMCACVCVCVTFRCSCCIDGSKLQLHDDLKSYTQVLCIFFVHLHPHQRRHCAPDGCDLGSPSMLTRSSPANDAVCH